MNNIDTQSTSPNEVITNSVEVLIPSITSNTVQSLKHLNIGHGKNLNNILDNMSSSSKTIATGIKELDFALGGGIRAGVTVIAAKPATGKTTVALQFAEEFSKSGSQVIYFCNDMPLTEVVAKGLSRVSYLYNQENGFSASDVLKHNENGLKDNAVFITTCENYKSNTENLRIIDISGSLDFNNVCKTIADYVALEKSQPIIIIDYLQKIVVSNTNSDKEKMDFLIEQLKSFAITYNLPILVLSSINRMSYNKELTMESLKESGGVEYNSDVIIGIQHAGVGNYEFDIKKAKAKNVWEMELVLLKNRMGNSDVKIPIQFYPKFNLFPYYAPVKENKKIIKTSDFIKI